MALLLILPGHRSEKLYPHLKSIDPDLDVRIWPEAGNPEEILFAVTWNHSPGVLSEFANIRAISSYGAGVDHLLRDPELPRVPIVRIVDPDLVLDIKEYVATAILMHKRNFLLHHENQRSCLWKSTPKLDLRTVGVLGLGHLGSETARHLAGLGFEVFGWSRAPKTLPEVECFYGSSMLDRLLAKSDFLVCILPLTSKTTGILNKSLFDKAKQGAYLINVGRGGHLNEGDLLDALASGKLSGACLDVFNTEPLPENHPFWKHPNILVTPHIASITNPVTVASQIVDNYRRLLRGDELLNRVDPFNEY